MVEKKMAGAAPVSTNPKKIIITNKTADDVIHGNISYKSVSQNSSPFPRRG